jgi:phage shock protein PspC (stress-responsive transcriptional regulator)
MANLGDRIGHYELLAPVGRGGMATVYRARDHRLERDVAIKVLAAEISTDPVFRARFEREYRIAAALRHPNILPIYDAGDWEGQLYIAMPLVEGPSLAAVIKRDAPLQLARVVSLAAQIASALDVADGQGIVHRDVNPANILLAQHGPNEQEHAYLVDFGLTRSVGSMTRMTRTGMFMGTLAYIAPEQLGADTIDSRADQYGLACTVYEMLSSTAPFPRDTDAALIAAHLYDPPPALQATRPDLPAAITDVIQRGMAKDPNDRYSTAGDWADALATAARTRSRSASAVAASASLAPIHALAATNPRIPVQGVIHGRREPWDQPPSRGSRLLPVVTGLFAIAGVLILAYIVARTLNSGDQSIGASPDGTTIAAAPGETPFAFPTTSPSPISLESPAIPTSALVVTPIPATLPPAASGWAVGISATDYAPTVGERISISAVANGDVALSGYSLVIMNPESGKVHNTCRSGAACVTEANPDLPGPHSYIARIISSDGFVQAESGLITVVWNQSAILPQPTPTATPLVNAPTSSPTRAPFEWSVSISVSNQTPGAGERVFITATANYDVTGTGLVIQIINPDTGKVHNSCSIGKTCSTNGEPGQGGTHAYQARISGTGGSDVRAVSDRVEVVWPAPPTDPPSTNLGPNLPYGYWSTVHSFDHVAYGSPEYQPESLHRTYKLNEYTCASETDCVAKFKSSDSVTDGTLTVRYYWNGSVFHYGPGPYTHGESCLGVEDAFVVRQLVDVAPGRTTDGKVDVLRGTMTLTGTTTATGQSLGCSDFEIVYNTEIRYIGQ